MIDRHPLARPRRHTAFALRLAWLLWPWMLATGSVPPAAANDFEAAGLASGLGPVEPSRIRLVAERVVLTQGAKDWHADATYIFHNPTAEAIDTAFAFPEGCPFAETNGNVTGFYVNPQLRDLTTLVRGQPVLTRLVEQRPWQGLALCIGRVHAFDIALAPNERVEVRHRYRFSAGTGIGFEEIQYITRTGALWNGPIGSEVVKKSIFGPTWRQRCASRGAENREAVGKPSSGNGRANRQDSRRNRLHLLLSMPYAVTAVPLDAPSP